MLGLLYLTSGGDTSNKRIDWNIEKSHSNDAICITDLQPNSCNVKEWVIKPMRRQSKAKTDNVLGIKHRDLVEYTFKNGETHKGYVTALYPELNALNFQSHLYHADSNPLMVLNDLFAYLYIQALYHNKHSAYHIFDKPTHVQLL